MSWQASKYARQVLAEGVDLTTGDRCVLMLLAEAAGSRTATALGGRWLATAAAMHPNSVRRAIYALEAAGIVSVRSNRPAPLAVVFPLAPSLEISTNRADERGSIEEQPRPPAYSTAPTGMVNRADRRDVPQRQVLYPTATPVASDDTVCVWCDQTGWEYEDDNHVRPCRSGCAA